MSQLSPGYRNAIRPPQTGGLTAMGGPSTTGLLVAGLAVAALGFLAWQYFGPDLVRYMKIRNM